MARVNITYNVEDETKRYIPNKSFYAEEVQLDEKCCTFFSKGGTETIIVPLYNVLSIKVEEQLD